MKFCYECGRLTAGEPLFCNHCGRSYEVKLCPRHHPNPRNASVCSQCGSHDLSMPQPRVPLWGKAVLHLVPLVFAVLLTVVSLAFLVEMLQELRHHPDVVFILAILIGFLWWLWSQIPESIRKFIYRLIKRRERHEER